MVNEKKILDFGCGNKKRNGSVGIDINSNTDADIVHDLNVFPYPFDDSTFDEVYADNVIEHLEDVIKVMEELRRVTKKGALIKIIVPYFRSKWAFIDPTHIHFFTVDSFSYFDPAHEHNRLYNYSKATFSIEKIIFNKNIKRSFFINVFAKFATRWPRFYETYLSPYLPLDDLTYYIRVVK